MNTNEKGNIGLIKVIADLYSKGFTCFKSFDDYNPVDCIAMNSIGKTFRLQIKYRMPLQTKSDLKRNGKYEICAKSVVNGKAIPIDRNLIDYWAVYLADIDTVVYLSIKEMEGKKTFYITPEQISEMDERLKSAPC